MVAPQQSLSLSQSTAAGDPLKAGAKFTQWAEQNPSKNGFWSWSIYVYCLTIGYLLLISHIAAKNDTKWIVVWDKFRQLNRQIMTLVYIWMHRNMC